MSMLRRLGLSALLLACCPWSTSQAGVYVGLGFGGPCYRPYYRPYWGGYGYYRPYGFGVYVAPPPVVVAPPPVVVQQPVMVQPAYTPPPAAPAPAPLPAPSPVSTATSSSAPEVMPAVAASSGGREVDSALQQLRSGDESGRADALVRLGRLKAERAIGPMVKALHSDSSPKVREAAARGLGLISAPSSLSALQYAAQADDDREVRHSASFAAECIRGSLPRR
jgi:hypothetical protein